MLRKVTLLLLAALPVLLVPLGTSAWAASPTITIVEGCDPPSSGPERYSLWVSACGPSHVIRNTNYTYGVVVKNYGKASFRKLTLSVIYYDPITRSSIPYRRAYNPMYQQHAAVWTLHNLKPGQFFRVNITLPFKQHNDPKGSNFVVEARGYGPQEVRGRSKDVIFIKSARYRASAAPTVWPSCPGPTPSLDPARVKLFVNACGPTHVIRGTNYNYTVVLTNVGNATYRRVKLTLIHEDPIARSSIPYSRALRPDYAIWTLTNFKPGRTFRVSFRLPFKQHNDPNGSNFVVEARADGPHAVSGLTKDVFFIK